jgi:hypothetical protein
MFQDEIWNETLSSLDFLLSFIRKTQTILFELRAQMNSTTIFFNTVKLPVKFCHELSDETSEIKFFCVKKTNYTSFSGIPSNCLVFLVITSDMNCAIEALRLDALLRTFFYMSKFLMNFS